MFRGLLNEGGQPDKTIISAQALRYSYAYPIVWKNLIIMCLNANISLFHWYTNVIETLKANINDLTDLYLGFYGTYGAHPLDAEDTIIVVDDEWEELEYEKSSFLTYLTMHRQYRVTHNLQLEVI